MYPLEEFFQRISYLLAVIISESVTAESIKVYVLLLLRYAVLNVNGMLKHFF